ncbi:MAG: alpha/beta fold hydrolase [Tannerella sp.]|jgi:alpha-beta hydrolase superfamily lysophospholipase|nr:alpha/beta fold hydrolase [Tannerella sp.]
MRKLRLFIFIFVVTQSISAVKPRLNYLVRPENYDLVYKEMDITTPDGYKIKTWFFPAQQLIHPDTIYDGGRVWPYFTWEKHLPRPYSIINEQPKPTIIICNGDSDNMGGWISFAPYFISHGYNVVNFDWRGFGESSFFPADTMRLSYTEYLVDYHAVIDSISTLKEVDAQNIGVYGASTGAYLSFAVAHTNPNVKCFAGRALMTCFDDFLPYLHSERPERIGIKKPEKYPVELFPVNIAPKFIKPTFLIVGEHDTRTPVWMSESIYEKLKEEKELWIVKGAAHGGGNGPEFINFAEWRERVVDFYDKYLKCDNEKNSKNQDYNTSNPQLNSFQ